MNSLRTAARAMLAGIFVAGGAQGAAHPDRLAPAAKRVTDQLAPVLQRIHPRLPTDTRTLVQLDHLVKLACGVLLVTPLRRPVALVLVGSLIPTTLAGHRFWETEEPAERANQQVHFLKNLGLMGGLLLAALDTEGRPGLRWRTTHMVSDANRSVRRGVNGTRTRARLVAHNNPIGRRLA